MSYPWISWYRILLPFDVNSISEWYRFRIDYRSEDYHFMYPSYHVVQMLFQYVSLYSLFQLSVLAISIIVVTFQKHREPISRVETLYQNDIVFGSIIDLKSSIPCWVDISRYFINKFHCIFQPLCVVQCYFHHSGHLSKDRKPISRAEIKFRSSVLGGPNWGLIEWPLLMTFSHLSNCGSNVYWSKLNRDCYRFSSWNFSIIVWRSCMGANRMKCSSFDRGKPNLLLNLFSWNEKKKIFWNNLNKNFIMLVILQCVINANI